MVVQLEVGRAHADAGGEHRSTTLDVYAVPGDDHPSGIGSQPRQLNPILFHDNGHFHGAGLSV
jgi:hypothetical protein